VEMQRWLSAMIRGRCGNVQEARVKSRSGRLVIKLLFVVLYLLYFETPIWSPRDSHYRGKSRNRNS